MTGALAEVASYRRLLAERDRVDNAIVAYLRTHGGELYVGDVVKLTRVRATLAASRLVTLQRRGVLASVYVAPQGRGYAYGRRCFRLANGSAGAR